MSLRTFIIILGNHQRDGRLISGTGRRGEGCFLLYFLYVTGARGGWLEQEAQLVITAFAGNKRDRGKR